MTLQIETIVFDLDDTLLNEDGKISPYTLDVLLRAKARGIHIVPASGRAVYSMRPYVDQIRPDNPYIACNGAILANPDHTTLEANVFTPAQAREIVHYLAENDFYVQCYHDEFFYYSAECDASRSYTRSSGMHGRAVGDLETFLDFETPKVLSVQHPDAVAKMLSKAQKVFSYATFTVSKPYFLEAQPAGVSKGATLRRLTELIHGSPETTLAFGDSLNDLSMLQFATHSVAMGNARNEVKQATRYVCAPNTEDGVARFIQQHVLEGGSSLD